MSYALLGDVVARYRPIISLIGSGSTDVTSEEVNSVYCAQAESFIDGYLALRYVVPVSPVPALITQLTADLAIFHMLAEKSIAVPEFMDKRYDRCLSILECLRDGEMVLGNSVTVAGSQGDNYAWSTTQGHHSVFHPNLDEFDSVPDHDRVQEAWTEREGDVGFDRNSCE